MSDHDTTPARHHCLTHGGAADPLYEEYHDEEWGRPVTGDPALFERLSLEGFQVGLSWLTVLRKRPAFREAFSNFDPATVACYGDTDVELLMADARIIRNRAKIMATIHGAQIVTRMHLEGVCLSDVIWSYRPASHARPEPGARQDTCPEALALTGALKRWGFRFVGPTNVYATMQACGLVNDHIVGCPVGDEIDARWPSG